MHWSQIEPIVVAVAIGLMIGAERERSHRAVPGHFGGIRTFALLSATGALAAVISPTVVAVGFCAVGALVAVGYWGVVATHPGSTTVVAALATYLLGALTRDHLELAVAVGVMIVVVLLSKERVHRLLRDVVTDDEVEDAIKMAVVAFVVLPLLPDRGMGPYDVLNPFRIWLLVVFIVGIGWLGYIGVRIFGARGGLLVSGVAGGFVSASATTSAMGRTAKAWPDRARPALAGALAASISTMVQLLVVIGVMSRQVVAELWAPSLSAAAVLAAAVWVVSLRSRRRVAPEGDASNPDDPAGEPDVATSADERMTVRAFALRPALILAAVITASVLFSRWASDLLGSGGAVAVSALAGLADGHAGAVSAASLAARGEISTSTAVWAAGASIGANTLVKIGLATLAGGRSFGRWFATGIVPAAVAFAAVLVLW